jgi:trimeric autotransporter adhesin
MKVRSGFGLPQRSSRFFTSVLWLNLLIFVGGCVVGTATLQASTPVITSVTPNSIVAGSQSTVITVVGSGFTSGSVIEWNGAPLSTSLLNSSLYATVSTSDLSTVGTATVQVDTPTAVPALSNTVVVQITAPPAPTLGSIYPNAGPINTEAAVTLNGTGFTPETTVAVNGAIVPSNFVSSGTITAMIPAVNLALPGNVNISVTTPGSAAGPSPALTYTVYINLANNDIVYNAVDGLLYASVPVSGPGTGGNTVVGIDPATGAIRGTIWVGSGPDKLALSANGMQLFVGLNGAAAVAQVNLLLGVVVNKFYLGGGQGVYNPPPADDLLEIR